MTDASKYVEPESVAIADLRPPPPDAAAELRCLLERARTGDPSAVPQLRAVLDTHPEIWHRSSDLALYAREAWISLIAGSDAVLAESLRRKTEALRQDLTSANAGPLEQLLVDRVVVAWLAVSHAEIALPQARDATTKQLAFAQSRLDLCGRQFRQAIAALTTARKLVPAGSRCTPSPLSTPTPVASEPSRDTPPATGLRVVDEATPPACDDACDTDASRPRRRGARRSAS